MTKRIRTHTWLTAAAVPLHDDLGAWATREGRSHVSYWQLYEQLTPRLLTRQKVFPDEGWSYGSLGCQWDSHRLHAVVRIRFGQHAELSCSGTIWTNQLARVHTVAVACSIEKLNYHCVSAYIPTILLLIKQWFSSSEESTLRYYTRDDTFTTDEKNNDELC